MGRQKERETRIDRYTANTKKRGRGENGRGFRLRSMGVGGVYVKGVKEIPRKKEF